MYLTYIYLFISLFIPTQRLEATQIKNPSTENLNIRRIILLIDYISGDYSEAISSKREILNHDEYEEMLEFASTTMKLYNKETKKHPDVLKQIKKLEITIKEKQRPSLVKSLALDLKKKLLEHHNLKVFLPSYPNLKKGQTIYQQNCANCHGEQGASKTPMAQLLTPAPKNLIEKEFAEELSPARVHNTLKVGIPNTAMISYEKILTEEEKWNVSFYVTNLFFKNKTKSEATTITQNKDLASPLKRLTWTHLASMSNRELKKWISQSHNSEQNNQKINVQLAQLRTFSFSADKLLLKKSSLEQSVRSSVKKSEDHLSFTLEKIKQTRIEFNNNKFEGISDLILDAYLEGFEHFEKQLKILAPEKLQALEKVFMNLRNLSNKSLFNEDFEKDLSTLELELEKISTLFAQSKKKKRGSYLSEVISSATIILREGFEAFLIIIALLSIVKNLGFRSAKKWIHSAWILAIACGFLTYYLINQIFQLSGANRELLEAFFTAFAVLMLFYTGFWLLSQSNNTKWTQFVKGESKSKLSQGNLWTFFGLAFIAVYREAAETVLFYQALLSTSNNTFMIVLGFVLGVLILSVLCMGLLYYNIKIPLAKFFKVTSSLMFLLSFILIGKTSYELIESGYLTQTPLNFLPTIEALGFYPYKETITSQMSLLMITVLLLWKLKVSDKKTKTNYQNKLQTRES